jgi:imidazoleglycerol phosphate synthase glutamine amidotransferase subunit HisH
MKAHQELLHPNFKSMTTQNRLLRVLKMAYAKHHLETPHIGWDELSDAMMCEICNTIGDDEFVQWSESINDEIESGGDI